MTGKSSIIGNKSELHPSITPFFGGCSFYFFVIPLPEWKCVWKTKRGHHACVPVSHNIRIGKFAEKVRLDDQNIEQIKKTFFQWSTLWIHISCFLPWYLWKSVESTWCPCCQLQWFRRSEYHAFQANYKHKITEIHQRNKHSRKGLDSIISDCDQCCQKKR